MCNKIKNEKKQSQATISSTKVMKKKKNDLIIHDTKSLQAIDKTKTDRQCLHCCYSSQRHRVYFHLQWNLSQLNISVSTEHFVTWIWLKGDVG